jgi:predicted hydrocarbon binding protein
MSDTPYFDEAAQSANFERDGQFNIIGVRAFITSCASIADWMDDLYMLLGERFINARLYVSARRAAKRTVAALLAEFRVPDDPAAKERFFTEFYAAIGWGHITYQLDYAKKTGQVVVKNSFLAQGFTTKFTVEGRNVATGQKSDITRCALLGAYLAAQVSNFLGEEVEMIEKQCAAMGHDVCIFEVSHERFSLRGLRATANEE